MYMERKKVIKELHPSTVNALIAGTTVLPLAAYVVWRTIDYLGDKLGIKANPFKDLLKNKQFVKELAEIIEDEGGIYDFLDKVKPKMKPGRDYDAQVLWNLGGINSTTFINNVAGKNAPRIVNRIMDTPIVKSFFRPGGKKTKVGSDSKADFENGLYYVITDPQFRRVYTKMLKDAGEDITLATRDMTDREKQKFFNLDDGKISLKSLLPKQ
jgi:hypothetical protein